MLRWRASHLFDLFDHDSAALSSSFFLPPNAGWCLGRVIWNTAVGQQLELGSWRPYGLCSFPRWWANSAEQVCTTGTSLIVKWHAMRAFTGLVSDTPEKQLSEATHPNINGIGYCTPWYNCLQIASKDILVFLDSCICLWIYPSARIACAEPKVWICDAMYATSHWARGHSKDHLVVHTVPTGDRCDRFFLSVFFMDCSQFHPPKQTWEESPFLVGGLEHEFYFSIYWACHHPNWRTYIFQRDRYTTSQICMAMFPLRST